MSVTSNLVIQVGTLPDLVVSNDPANPGRVIMRWLDGTDANQQWVEEPALNGFYLRNVATGTYLAFGGDDQPVGLSSHGDVWQKTGPNQDFTAIRLALRTSQNLNALGGHPVVGTVVGTWSWGGGAGNEIWQVQTVSAVWPRPTQTFSFISGMAPYLQLSVDPKNTAGALVVDDNYATQAPAAFVFTATQWIGGFSIVNKASGLLAYVSGDGNGSSLLQRAANQLNVDSLWTYGGGGAFQAIRPWIDSGQNWNVFGNPHPIPKGPLAMGTWSWGHGQANEIWQTVVPATQARAASILWTGEAIQADGEVERDRPAAAAVAEVWAQAQEKAGVAARANGHH
ncbi:hypothetical protein UAJ10_12125 [Nitrospirillum sp. BR 11164]|uniref:hypothetical protein n=1 Tax=Nitrospirillum sp. BR 11164 TaxID=3104324 RepID=UPI002AFFB2AD|nr:hypothetical protein [Nitrospirillum sp. BR 11164]MEA1649758.1 hypothetical protein [Nitrospirillum sp. BR 11164]